jgi:hypothetical protein
VKKVMDARVKKTSSSMLKSLSEKCQLSRFSDYFVVCGLDLENGLEADLYTGESTGCAFVATTSLFPWFSF